MAPNTRKQHFIPELHLRQFADPAVRQTQLWVHFVRHPSRRPQLKAPAAICYKPHAYTVPGFAHESPMFIERSFFGPVEDEAAKALARLATDPGARLNREEERKLRLYVCCLMVRHPRYLEARYPAAAMDYEAGMKQQMKLLASELLSEFPSSERPNLDALINGLDLQRFAPPDAINEDGTWRVAPAIIGRDLQSLFPYFAGLEIAVAALRDGEEPLFLPDLPVVTWICNRKVRFATPISPITMLIVGDGSPAQLVSEWNVIDQRTLLARACGDYCYSHQRNPQLATYIAELQSK